MMNLIKVGLSTCYNADFNVEQWSCPHSVSFILFIFLRVIWLSMQNEKWVVFVFSFFLYTKCF